ncbi:MAG: 2TM domain-containing protein [Bacteroidia bacterium]
METEKDKELWKLARKRVGFKRHLMIYTVMNVFFWVMWYLTDHLHEDEEMGGIPWPVFPMVGWGLGVMFNFLGAYVFTKHNAVEKEYEKLKNS